MRRAGSLIYEVAGHQDKGFFGSAAPASLAQRSVTVNPRAAFRPARVPRDPCDGRCALWRCRVVRPVRVQWMREQELNWEPYGSAMLSNLRAALGSVMTDHCVGLH
jgi:hypothetical protein